MADKKVEEPLKDVAVAAQQAVRSESAPPRVRRYRAIAFQGALVLIAAAFGGLTFLVKTIPFFAFDLQVTKNLQLINAPVFVLLMSATSWPGFSPQATIIAVLFVLLIYAFGLHWESVSMLIGLVLSTAMNVLVKDLVQRPRPLSDLVNVFARLTDYSFPSGHVMYYISLFGFSGFLVFTLLKPSYKRTFLMVILAIPVALVGISRVYLGEHWASDVIGSYLLGVLILVATIQIYRWGKTRFFVRQPVAPANNQKA